MMINVTQCILCKQESVSVKKKPMKVAKNASKSFECISKKSSTQCFSTQIYHNSCYMAREANCNPI